METTQDTGRNLTSGWCTFITPVGTIVALVPGDIPGFLTGRFVAVMYPVFKINRPEIYYIRADDDPLEPDNRYDEATAKKMGYLEGDTELIEVEGDMITDYIPATDIHSDPINNRIVLNVDQIIYIGYTNLNKEMVDYICSLYGCNPGAYTDEPKKTG